MGINRSQLWTIEPTTGANTLVGTFSGMMVDDRLFIQSVSIEGDSRCVQCSTIQISFDRSSIQKLVCPIDS